MTARTAITRILRAVTPLTVCGALLAARVAVGQTTEAVFAAYFRANSTDRIIVKMRSTPVSAAGSSAPRRAAQPDMDSHARRFSARASIALTHLRALSGRTQLLGLPGSTPLDEARALAQRIAQDPEVEYAEPDYRVRLLQVAPNDAEYIEQWYLHDPIGGINAPLAWQVSTGNPNIVVAVLDSGIVPHADLIGRTVAGYDFVSADVGGGFAVANDGDGRDADASDPGDWITVQQKNTVPAFISSTCPAPEDSSWHGTLIAGIIGAATNNGDTAAGHRLSIAGVTWTSMIQPVRVFGKCLGYLSDFADGIRWAAGGVVPNVALNMTPAQVINLSIGADGSCPQTMRLAISDAFALGVKAVVIAAGNEDQSASLVWPGNCGGGVSAVTATSKAGVRASYGNFGDSVTLAAPGGQSALSEGLISIANSGDQAPEPSPLGDDLLLVTGTSFSAPLVAGSAALVLAVRPQLGADELRSVLQASARPFTPGSDCDQKGCGAGILDAGAAVALAQTGFIVSPYRLDFAATATGQTSPVASIVARNYSAALVNIGSAALSGALAGVFTVVGDSCSNSALASGASCAINLTFAPNAAGIFRAALTLPSNVGTGTATVNLLGREASVPVNANPPPSGGDGGGCSIAHGQADWTLIVLLLLLLLARYRPGSRQRVRASAK